MARRRLFFAFLLYLTLDLSNPFVAGAFNFNPDECVEGLRHRASSFAERIDASELPARTPVVRLALPSPSAVPMLAGGRHTILEWLVDSREDTRASGDPPAPAEDH
jgi:hypothetical protein